MRWWWLVLIICLGGACEQIPEPPRQTTISADPTPASTLDVGTPSVHELSPPSGLTAAMVTRIVDGDTIEVEIGGQTSKLRYIGIDTPETVDPRRSVQCFGSEASERNRQLVQGKEVGLEKDVRETDDFGRLLRYVWIGERMVNAILVGEGYAQAATYPPDVRYAEVFAELQADARNNGRGLWGAACASPTPTAATAGVCEYSGTARSIIKGNISTKTGEKIYHVPGGEFYDITVIDASRGERWFCSEADALAAGWRRSMR